ncbi:unnamed protein product [Pleuronectes platessa]|uniref:Uncharacterized protein n=1 Tax=Pleuronectes platessa TaxID=8262 RepID=A0A9N7V7Q9_PLEPL|nr:unnamed protein product [Pleuronectes platessa]
MGGGEIYQASRRVEQVTDRWSRAGRLADQLVPCSGEAALCLHWASNPLQPHPVPALNPAIPHCHLLVTNTAEQCPSRVVSKDRFLRLSQPRDTYCRSGGYQATLICGVKSPDTLVFDRKSVPV